MSAKIDVNMKRFRGDVDRFRRQSRQTFRDVMHSQMGLLCTHLMKLYPPASTGALKAGGGSPRSIGKRNVATGVSEVAAPVIMGAARKARPFEGHMLYQDPSTEALWLVPNEDWSPESSIADVRSRHRAAKRNRKGRPPKSRNSKHKGFTVVNKLHVKRSVYRKYIRQAQGSVGKLKSGWVSGMVRFGRTPPAGWITDHASRMGASRVVADTPARIDLRAVNKAAWADKYPSVVNFAIRTRSTDLQKHAMKRLRKDVREENRRSKMRGVA